MTTQQLDPLGKLIDELNDPATARTVAANLAGGPRGECFNPSCGFVGYGFREDPSGNGPTCPACGSVNTLAAR